MIPRNASFHANRQVRVVYKFRRPAQRGAPNIAIVPIVPRSVRWDYTLSSYASLDEPRAESAPPLLARYRELQDYVGWTADDARLVRAAADCVRPAFTALIDDFYAEIERHPAARRVITGGHAQIARLKQTLLIWLDQLVSGQYDAEYVARRVSVGQRHVQIGLDAAYTHAALARLRMGLLAALRRLWRGDGDELQATTTALNKLLDLDLAVIQDAYQARQTHEVLRRERDFAEGMIESAPTVVLLLDPDGRILKFNAFLERLCGYSLNEIQGQDWFEKLLPREDVARIRRVFLATIEGHDTSGIINPVVSRAGRRHDIQWSNRRIHDTTGRLVGVLCIGHDLTELREAQRQAVQSARLAAIGEMVAGLAHESRNALQRSQASLELLALEVADRPEAIDLVNRIQRAQTHLHHLYEEVRGYAAPITLHSQVCDLREIWRETWTHVLETAGKAARLRDDSPDVDLVCYVDRHAVSQLFRNVLENSVAATEEPVEVMIRCTLVERNGRPFVRVALRDNGPGFTAEQLRRLFEPFFTTKTQGTGLGMAIARRIVESHGGTIRADNHPAGGAEIVFTLPRQES